VEKKDKMVFSYLVWGGTRRYGGVGRKSLPPPTPLFSIPCSTLEEEEQ